MGKHKEIRVSEFPLDEIKSESGNDSKIVIIGKPGSGKSVLIRDIVRTFAHKFPTGIVFSGSEDNNGFYGEMFDNLFIYSEYNEDVMRNIYLRQKRAQKDCSNPKLMLIIDDCSDDPKFFRRPLFQKFFKLGRHWDVMLVLCLHYAHDIPSTLKGLSDYVFMFREPNAENRKKLYRNYATIAGSPQDFEDIMDQITGDYTSLVINNRIQTNNNTDCIFYYKARIHKDFRFGCAEAKAWNSTRYEPNYKENITLE
jgi:ABC-type dipeptide/oligopeptide/nickel transport system ATPase component